MKVSSNDFKPNELMDKKFAYRDKNLSPHIQWADAPSATKSFALSCNDPDAPVGNWIHWLIINIPEDVNEIAQGGPVPGEELTNDYGKKGYGGPAPPSGTHRYVFKVYALDVEELKGIDKDSFDLKVNDHALDSAEIIGKYKA